MASRGEKSCVVLVCVPQCHLQVGAEEGPLFGVLIVVPHQQVEQNRRFGPEGRQLGDAALEHFAAESLAQRHAAFEQHGRELAGQRVSMLKVRSEPGGSDTFSTGEMSRETRVTYWNEQYPKKMIRRREEELQ